jgi:hypothetical protein
LNRKRELNEERRMRREIGKARLRRGFHQCGFYQ